MPCTIRKTRAELAEAGWTEEDIALMEKEVELARAKANVEAARKGLSKDEQADLMARAEAQARKDWDEKMHAKLDAMMDQIRALGAAKKLPVH